MKRVRIVIERPNWLFESWLEEWMREAGSRNNSDLKYHFSKALISLRKYPLPLRTGRDCIILQNFGTKLCAMLDRKLLEYRATNGTNVSEYICVSCDYKEAQEPARRKQRVRRKSEEITRCAERPLRDEIADVAIVTSNNNENCVPKNAIKVAEIPNIEKRAEIRNGTQDHRSKKKTQTTTRKKATKSDANKEANEKNVTSDSNNVDICMLPNEFDIILLVDTQETCGGKTRPQDDATLAELSQLAVLFEVRHLKVGDFAWIARCRHTNRELVLPYIVERKRIDDLSASIRDGRFHEQKFRLKQSGIENLVYIVENYDKTARLAIPHSSLMQASINSLVQERFTLKYTRSHRESMFYLSSLTRILNKVFKEKSLIGCKKENILPVNMSSNSVQLMEFTEFNKAASKHKTFTVNQMFVRQLLQLKGLSVEKAMAIVERYQTPKLLIDALNADSNGELLLANVQFGTKKRLIGPVLSKTVYQLYTRKNFN